MIPGIAPAIATIASPVEHVIGSITIGNLDGLLFGYFSEDNKISFPLIGALSGEAADFIEDMFIWDPTGFVIGEAGGFATQKIAILQPLALGFQDSVYVSVADPVTEEYMWTFGPEVADWPRSGTHPFMIIDPTVLAG